ncbi:SMI1/KNR4 family protein [Hazenella coriacea]|uniref:SMI1/KNR4 family protein SUKH-1 n=1 Tax=Hazenella coriacea TaxID=1179467 RepID=A0A4R3L628_9BACL|nr:SMI1/KNR4 family protein [Hazenella coriacea]TCS92839.1 SMI1/KNR4 family protein SUKH-1 [Hazenella coriacea]
MITWLKREVKLPIEEFAQIEESLGICFPRDYVDWIQKHRRPESGHAHILIDDEPYHFDELYDLEEIIDEVEALFEGNEELKETGLIVPIGFDSALNPYSFYYGQSRENPIIIWFSSDDALSEIFNGTKLNLKQVRIVRQSFTKFINDLYVRTDY